MTIKKHNRVLKNYRLKADLVERLKKEAYKTRKTMTMVLEEALETKFAVK